MGAASRITLVGMMGSGKSTIGAALSAATGWPYVDNDEVVRQVFGATPREILATGGESALREAESRALMRAFVTPAPRIVGAAAGTILDEDARRRLSESESVVWLRASPETLEARAAGGEHRPWIDGNAGEWIRTTLAERERLYESAADLTVDVDELSPEEVAALIRERLNLRGG